MQLSRNKIHNHCLQPKQLQCIDYLAASVLFTAISRKKKKQAGAELCQAQNCKAELENMFGINFI